ncbi:helix-turn-helix transcriptional regulator [Flexivirga sp. ID2601S]|uniref:Helix-turn-helix transcriptional regulator n=1 Tax=Flexivirga aerilata TaxID=1656889 RepID=A0A849AW38_9MICO|nr:helix-turn-helix transcriptional regulator [Flexivirga aerilata]NNG40882.1 helix-turn-helix transcriptional regulator [Flexivirga aerilata]
MTAAVGELLREWRESRALSQQALSDISTVSTRHLSRVETGKARPTPQMILHLSEHLNIPLRERNRLLLAGGFAPRYGDSSLDDDSLAGVMAGLRDLLDAHLPYPALLLDDYWDVVDANAAVDALLVGCAPHLLEPPINVLRLCVDPQGLAPRIANLAEWSGHLLRQLRHRALQTRDARHAGLVNELNELNELDELAALVDAPDGPGVTGPVVTLELETADGTLRFFSTTARLTTATDAALEGLHLETFLPADASTRRLFA